MISGVVAIVACIAAGLALTTWLRVRSLRESLQEAHRRLYLAQARLNELEQTVHKEVRALRADIRRQAGESRFDPRMKLADAIAIDPRVREVLAQFHLGGCQACAVDEEATIEQTAMTHGVNIDQLMMMLEALGLEALGNEQPQLQSSARRSGLLQLSDF